MARSAKCDRGGMVTKALTRRAFFLPGDLRQEAEVVRPPQAVAERRFTRLCEDCSACVDACPEAIIIPDRAGRPTLDFMRGACTFCGECANACPTGALDPNAARPWTWTVAIGASCLSENGVTCRSCADACETGAIRFRLQTGGRDIPLLDTEACTGCGGCRSVCPVDAITLSERERVSLQQEHAA